MDYAPFAEYFPEIADTETKVLSVLNETDGGPPIGKYFFMELFCTDPGCDCRNARIVVVKYGEDEVQEPLTCIRFCWEKESFYKSIDMNFRPYCLEFPGAFLDPMGPSSPYDEYFLNVFNSMCHTFSLIGSSKEAAPYVERIKKHYEMFKEYFRRASIKKRTIEKKCLVGRNDPCSCGSKVKYKKCCGA